MTPTTAAEIALRGAVKLNLPCVDSIKGPPTSTKKKEGKKVIYIANLSKTNQKVKLDLNGTFTNFMTNEKISFSKGKEISLQPWQYYIVTN